MPDSAPTTNAPVPTWQELDRLPLAALVLANLLPLAGVLLFDWDAGSLLVLYWMENLVVGGYTLLRMIYAGGLGGALTGVFFLVHYGAFCGGHGFFLLMFTHPEGFSGGNEVMRSLGDAEWFGPLVFIQLLIGVLEVTARQAPAFFGLPLAAFVLSHGVSTFIHQVRGREDEGRTPPQIMGDPYRRIVALHVAIIAGGALVMMTGSATWMLMILVALKLAMDVALHRRAHARRAALRQALS